MYEQTVLPLHSRLMGKLQDSGQYNRELVIGGDTVAIAGLLSGTGANILLCDYAADAHDFKSALEVEAELKVRRNVAPVSLENGHTAEALKRFCEDLDLFTNPIAGTGILPYDFVPDWLLDFQSAVESWRG